MENQLALATNFISPAIDVKGALERYQAMKEFIEGVLKKDHDFGANPGSDKPALLKPGAEKLASFFGLRALFSAIEKIEDWTGEKHGGEPFFSIQYKCQLVKNGEIVGEGVGSCNSWETKYRYREGKRVCPACGKETIIKGKEEYGGGWLCFAKKGGCGAKFQNGDQSIESQQIGRVKNAEIFDQVNTIDKMAQKRSLVAAVLITTNASDYFTQDIDDFVKQEPEIIDGEFTEPKPAAKQPEQKAKEPELDPSQITPSVYWTLIKITQKKTQEYGQQLLDKNGGDFAAAYHEAKHS